MAAWHQSACPKDLSSTRHGLRSAVPWAALWDAEPIDVSGVTAPDAGIGKSFHSFQRSTAPASPATQAIELQRALAVKTHKRLCLFSRVDRRKEISSAPT